MSKGMRYMLFATLLFSVMQVLVKYLEEYPYFELIFFRSIISLFISIGTIKSLNISLFGNNKRLLILRGLFGTASLSCFFYSLKHAPMGSVVTIVNIKPFLILLVAYFLLKEKIKPIQFLFFFISFIGIVMVKEFDNEVELLPLLTTIGAAFFAAIAHTIVRILRTTDHPVVIIFYFTLIAGPAVLPFTLLYRKMPTEIIDWILLVSIGVITHFAQFYLTKAYQSEEVAKISYLYYLGIVFAVGFGIIIFNETYNTNTVFGLLTIVGGIILNVIYSSKKPSTT